MQRLDDRSRMSGDVHVRFSERLEGRLLRATRLVICVKSTSAGYRVMDWVKRFLIAQLKLVINEEKSKVVKTNALHFLGFTFRGKKIHWSDKVLSNFKHHIRRLTKRS